MKYKLLIIIAVLAGCTDRDISMDQVALEGQWVNVHTKTDTLTFGVIGPKEYMILGRGKELRNGFLLPKNSSGPYDYALLNDDKISLRWTLSSNSNFSDYYFKLSADELTIEKFFDTTATGTMLTFKKLD